MQLSKDFQLKEFEAVSHRKLTAAEIQKAQQHVGWILQPLRRRFGRIKLTSFVRTGTNVGGGNHANGDGLDWVPLDATIDEVFEFMAMNMTLAFGELIHERNHIHHSLPGAKGEFGEVMREPVEGRYEFA